MNTDRIAKQRLNVILIVDTSKSMGGNRIQQVNNAISDIKYKLIDMQNENANVDFYVTIITFSTEAHLYNNDKMKNVEDLNFQPIKTGGQTNLHLAYIELKDLLDKEKRGGIMPDFGGVAPIILLLTDGHPGKWPMTDEMNALRQLPWFNVAIRYGIAIELNDKRTIDVLSDFVGTNGDVITCYNPNLLEKIIKIIILTTSKVQSTNTAIRAKKESIKSVNADVKMQIQESLNDVENWEW